MSCVSATRSSSATLTSAARCSRSRGGTVQKARRLAPPSNIGWEITVEPTGDGNVVITLPGSRACDVVGAICTSDGDQLSGSISATVSGPAPTVPAPAATIAPGTSPVAEGAAASFTVSLDVAAPATLSVAVSVADTDGVLSGAAPTSIAFAAGDNSKTLTLPTRDDNVIKTASTVTVSLVTGSGYTLGTTTSASVSVTDDDTATWRVSAQPTEIDEGESCHHHRSCCQRQDLRLQPDHQPRRQRHGGQLRLQPVGDGAHPQGGLKLGHGHRHRSGRRDGNRDSVGQSISSATVTISDTDESLTSAAADSLTASFLGVPALRVQRSRAAFQRGIVISYSDSGSVFQSRVARYRRRAGLAPPSNIGWEITVEPTGDGNVVITLPGSRACDVAGAICTSDGDQLYASISATVSGPAPVVSAPVATIALGTTPVAEGAAASFTVSLDGAAPATLSVAVSVADTDGVLSGAAPTSIAFAAGDDSKTLTLPTRDDNVIKAASTVTVSLVTGNGYTLGTTTSASVSVTDNDDATWTVSAQPTEIDEGGSSTITVAVANGKTFASNQTISLAVSGTAASSDYSLSATELTLRAGAKLGHGHRHRHRRRHR